jgi:hypothetical protein
MPVAEQEFQQLQEILRSELRGFREALIADHKNEMNKYMEVWEEQFAAQDAQRQHLDRQLNGLHARICCTEAEMSIMSQRIDNYAVQQLVQNAERKLFENGATAKLESFDENLQLLHQSLKSNLRLAGIPTQSKCAQDAATERRFCFSPTPNHQAPYPVPECQSLDTGVGRETSITLQALTQPKLQERFSIWQRQIQQLQ